MLELRPTCEHCNKSLPPDAAEARICSFECTFCANCVDLIENVCPNCGGGFSQRPTRPVREWRAGESLTQFPASQRVRHRPVDLSAHAAFAARIRDIPPTGR